MIFIKSELILKRTNKQVKELRKTYWIKAVNIFIDKNTKEIMEIYNKLLNECETK